MLCLVQSHVLGIRARGALPAPYADLSQKKKVEEEPECVNLEVWVCLEIDELADCFTWIFNESSWDTTQWDMVIAYHMIFGCV